jgi:AraC family transcriptional regulator
MGKDEPFVVDLSQTNLTEKILPRSPLLSSQEAGWNGIHLEYHRQPAHEVTECCFAQHIICIQVGRAGASLTVDGHFQGKYYTDGDIRILPAHQYIPRTRCDGEADFIILYLEPKMLARIASESVDTDLVELIPQLKCRDPLIQQIGLALKSEFESGGVDSCLYAESMATALSAHLLRKYSAHKPVIRDYTGGLPKYKLQKAIAYINSNLDQNLALAELAAVVEMSPHYFASLFKQSTGLAPHQYITQCRVERAKLLLAKRELGILEICQQIGFQSQSHFTSVFRKYTATTPKAYRDAL